MPRSPRTTSDWRDRVTDALHEGIAAVDPERLVATALPKFSETSGRIVVLALGKAASGMARGALDVLGRDVDGVVVAPEVTPLPPLDVIAGGHPAPTAASFEAGRRLLEAAGAAGADDLIVVLLSGGASSLAEVPAHGWSPDDIREAAEQLLASGEPIDVVNRRRAAMSALKDGGLTRAARPARVVTLAISDVPPAMPEAIGSGPSIGSDEFRILADGATAARAAAESLSRDGLAVTVLATRITGPAAAAGRGLATTAIGLEPGSALVGHGETTVALDRHGRGGRNQELALAAAIEIAGSDVLLAAIGTDGIDGPTDNAGAIVDGTTIARGAALGIDAERSLAEHDSATYLEAVGNVIITGLTGTNVGDLAVALSPPAT